MARSKPGFTKASDQIRIEIETAIEQGTLLPGDSIDESELAAQYQVSRTPIREALIRLQAQGLLSSRPRGGMTVAKMDLPQLLSMWELMAELEGVAVRLASQRMTARQLADLVASHESSRAVMEADDADGWQEANLRFHECIYSAARNKYLRQDILRMRALTGYYRRHAFGALGRIRTSFEQHGQIVAALQRGDAAAASTKMIDHMRPASDAEGLTNFIANMATDGP
ncbi:MAG: GntR family transcriptional regulator [Burkholderiaceae bacterium]